MTESFLNENEDVATLLALLGVVPTEGMYDAAPSAHTILSAQTRVIALYKQVEANPFTANEAKAELGTLFGWFQATEQTNPERKARARKGATKYGKGNENAHLLIQLVEELGEMAAEVSPNLDTQAQPIEIQKRALRVLRFGGDTVIKQEGPYQGLTNQQAYEPAIKTTEPVQEKDWIQRIGFKESNPADFLQK